MIKWNNYCNRAVRSCKKWRSSTVWRTAAWRQLQGDFKRIAFPKHQAPHEVCIANRWKKVEALWHSPPVLLGITEGETAIMCTTQNTALLSLPHATKNTSMPNIFLSAQPCLQAADSSHPTALLSQINFTEKHKERGRKEILLRKEGTAHLPAGAQKRNSNYWLNSRTRLVISSHLLCWRSFTQNRSTISITSAWWTSCFLGPFTLCSIQAAPPASY